MDKGQLLEILRFLAEQAKAVMPLARTTASAYMAITFLDIVRR